MNDGGTLTLTGGVLTPASMTVNAGGAYEHAMNGGTIPTATWAATSNSVITGITTTLPAGVTQNFGNLTWNCTNQMSNVFPVVNIQGGFEYYEYEWF